MTDEDGRSPSKQANALQRGLAPRKDLVGNELIDANVN